MLKFQLLKQLENLFRTDNVHLEDPFHNKDGIRIFRAKIEETYAVVKKFDESRFVREISNYKMLTEFNVPTLKVLGYGDTIIVLEDIEHSNLVRLGNETDLRDINIAKKIAQWYVQLHLAGLEISKDGLYRESDEFKRANLSMLNDLFPEASPTLEYLLSNFHVIRNYIDHFSETITYNDFYWTNLIVSKDFSSAMMFDYNLLGRGYAYGDIRNVCSSLSPEAGSAFIETYDEEYRKQSGRSRNLYEKNLDDVISPIITLVFACRKARFPAWGNESKRKVVDGSLHYQSRVLMDIIG